MFTGIVETLGTVDDVREMGPGVRLLVRCQESVADVVIGESIAVNGCCLTVVEIHANLKTVGFDAGRETLSRTNLGHLQSGGFVNLERSLSVGDRMGGHFVTGHIDTQGELVSRQDEGEWSTFWFQIPRPFDRQLASKGSIAIDGVSLTLVDVESNRFSVALIPHTLNVTTLGRLEPGDAVNLETDILAKYVERQLHGHDA